MKVINSGTDSIDSDMDISYTADQLIMTGSKLGSSPCLDSSAWERIIQLGIFRPVRGTGAGREKQRHIATWSISRTEL